MQEVMLAVKPGETREIEVRIRNLSRELNTGDARATPLLRVEEQGISPLQIVYTAQEGKDITAQALCHGEFDGYFVGGLEPGESRTVVLKITRPAAAAAIAAKIQMKLYWNPQDPQAVVRDALVVNLQ